MRTNHGGRGPVSFPAGCRAAMEMDASGPGSRSKKRKRHAMRTKQGGRGPDPVSKKRKPAPIGTPALAQVTDDQGPPPGAGAADRISLIPDTILGEIVSLLPSKEGARTQFLASRWRHIWSSAPLNLDCSGLADPRLVSLILTSHQAPVRRLCIPAGHGYTEATVEAWLQYTALDRLEEIEFCYVRDYGPPSDYWWWETSFLPLPPASIEFCYVRLANIGRCRLSDSTVQGLHFPQLKQLVLHWVRISECSIHRLISGCPALECLLLYYISGFYCLQINAPRLRSIGVRRYFPTSSASDLRLAELTIVNAPCLKRLFRLELFHNLEVSVISAPQMETFGSVDILHPNFSDKIKGLSAHTLSTAAACLVKSLAVHMPVLDLDKVIDLIRCFPYIEKLYILNEPTDASVSRPKNFWRRKYRNLIGCLDIRLKTVVIENFKGSLSKVNFATFFVQNARELELMTIQVETIDDEFIARQQRLLLLEKKASRGARFHFTTDRCVRDIRNIDVRDLDLTDPFLC